MELLKRSYFAQAIGKPWIISFHLFSLQSPRLLSDGSPPPPLPPKPQAPPARPPPPPPPKKPKLGGMQSWLKRFWFVTSLTKRYILTSISQQPLI